MFSLGLCSCLLAGHANRLNSDGFCYWATLVKQIQEGSDKNDAGGKSGLLTLVKREK